MTSTARGGVEAVTRIARVLAFLGLYSPERCSKLDSPGVSASAGGGADRRLICPYSYPHDNDRYANGEQSSGGLRLSTNYELAESLRRGFPATQNAWEYQERQWNQSWRRARPACQRVHQVGTHSRKPSTQRRLAAGQQSRRDFRIEGNCRSDPWVSCKNKECPAR